MSRRKPPAKTAWTCYVVIWEPNISPDYTITISNGHFTLNDCDEAGKRIAVAARREGKASVYACQHVESGHGPNTRERDGALGAMLDIPPERQKALPDASKSWEIPTGGIIA